VVGLAVGDNEVENHHGGEDYREDDPKFRLAHDVPPECPYILSIKELPLPQGAGSAASDVCSTLYRGAAPDGTEKTDNVYLCQKHGFELSIIVKMIIIRY
jgi:hypothetical protein